MKSEFKVLANKRRNTKARKAYAARKTKGTAAVTQVVNRVLNSQIETKYIRETIAADGAAIWNSRISGSADWYRAVPLVSRGNNSNNRIGDKITPKSLKVNWSFHFDKTDDNTRDIYVVLYLLTSKSNKDYLTNASNGALSANFDQYLDNGNDTTTFFSGTWADSQKPINKENFTLLKKKIINLCKGSGLPNGRSIVPPPQFDSSGNVILDLSGNVNNAAATSGMYTHERTVRANYSYTFKSTPKDFLYSDVSLSRPSNFAPVWAVGYYYADGTAPDTTAGLLQVACESHLYYKDA